MHWRSVHCGNGFFITFLNPIFIIFIFWCFRNPHHQSPNGQFLCGIQRHGLHLASNNCLFSCSYEHRLLKLLADLLLHYVVKFCFILLSYSRNIILFSTWKFPPLILTDLRCHWSSYAHWSEMLVFLSVLHIMFYSHRVYFDSWVCFFGFVVLRMLWKNVFSLKVFPSLFLLLQRFSHLPVTYGLPHWPFTAASGLDQWLTYPVSETSCTFLEHYMMDKVQKSSNFNSNLLSSEPFRGAGMHNKWVFW
jgi:hypothetical protein